MFKIKIDKRRRYLFIIGAILLFLGLIYRVLPFLQSIESGGTQIALKEREIAAYRRAVQEGQGIEERLISLNRSLERGESGLLKGTTPALASVDIQNRLNTIAKRNGIEIKRLRVLKPEQTGEDCYLSIPVKFNITSTLRQLTGLLYRIESSPKYMMVKTVRISSRGRSTGQIQSDITVSGLMKK
ncbi:MAG: type II secretion system protein GspM [Thermodesulfobacteriota bacterium]|nr:type II secretion system protein GspM [Thermodesulfobacteriota bacterium]